MATLFGTTDVAIGMKESITRVRLFDGPLDLSWHHCATISDFIADIFALQAQSRDGYREVRHNIGYLVNELVENAVKFRAPGDIALEAAIDSECFKVKVSNVIDDKTAVGFQSLLSKITVGDPGELLIQRIEANAMDPEVKSSSLGLLTLMSDYGARLAWILSQAGESDLVFLETYASIPLSPNS